MVETLEEEVIEEALQGVDLATITEEWKQKGINSISKQQLQKNEGAYLLLEELNSNPTIQHKKAQLQKKF